MYKELKMDEEEGLEGCSTFAAGSDLPYTGWLLVGWLAASTAS
jgi:hypothetical protein